jgi:hypothetical protein
MESHTPRSTAMYAKDPEIILPPIATAATLAQVPEPTLLYRPSQTAFERGLA